MFNFNPTKYLRPKGQPEFTTTEAQVPDEYIDRLDAIAKQLVLLEHQNNELKRTMVRMETKLTRFGIAAGYPDAVSRSN